MPKRRRVIRAASLWRGKRGTCGLSGGRRAGGRNGNGPSSGPPLWLNRGRRGVRTVWGGASEAETETGHIWAVLALAWQAWHLWTIGGGASAAETETSHKARPLAEPSQAWHLRTIGGGALEAEMEMDHKGRPCCVVAGVSPANSRGKQWQKFQRCDYG